MPKFENDSFIVETTEEPGCRIAASITILPSPTQKAYKKAVKLVNKQISIPGFRKGRAPDATVISRHASYVEQEWKEILLNDAYRATLDLTEIYPMNKESIDRPKVESCSHEEGAVVTLAYEHSPKTPEVDFSALTVPEIALKPVEEGRLEEIITEIKQSHADWEEIEDREVQEMDFVDVTIDAIDEDPPKSIVKDRRFEVDEKRMAPWMKKLLMGMKKSDAAEGLSEVDPEATDDVKKNFKPTKVRIVLNAILKSILPELTDELAQKVGADSVDDLKTKIRTNLENEAKDLQQQEQFEALEKALLETYAFDLPASIVESERVERIRKHLEELKKQGVSDEEIQGREKEIEAEVATLVDADLRLYFLHKQITKQGKISLTNEELNEAVTRQMTQLSHLYGKELDKETSNAIVSRVASSLMEQKAKEYALSQVLAKNP